LVATGGVIVYSGIDSIRTGRDVKLLKQNVRKYEPFRISENDKETLNRAVKNLVIEEGEMELTPPNLHFLTFPGQSPDAAAFQEILKHAFEQAGKKIESHHNLEVTGTHLDGTPWDGVIIQVNDSKNPPVLGKGLFALLLHLEIKVWSKEGSGYGTNDIVIYSHRPSYVRKDAGD
jgi:hypothetical protein